MIFVYRHQSIIMQLQYKNVKTTELNIIIAN